MRFKSGYSSLEVQVDPLYSLIHLGDFYYPWEVISPIMVLL